MLQYFDSAGRLVLRDPSVAGSPIVTDTDRGMLFTPANQAWSGSVSIPSRSAFSQGIDGTQQIVDVAAEYYIATPTFPAANILRGLMRCSDDPAGLWRDAKGTRVRDEDAVAQTMVPQTDLVTMTYLATMRCLTPMINGLGHLVLRERTIIRPRDPGSPPTITKTLPAITVDYRLHSDFWYGNPLIVPRPDAELRLGTPQFVSSTTYTATGVNFGYAYPGRRLVLAILNPGRSTNPTAVTIGGVAATIHDTIATSNSRITIASAVVPTGETGTISVTNATAASTWITVCLFAVRSITGAAPTTYKATSASASSLGVTLPAGGSDVGVALALRENAAVTCAWTGADEVHDGGEGRSAAIVPVPGGTVSATFAGAAGPMSILAAVFT